MPYDEVPDLFPILREHGWSTGYPCGRLDESPIDVLSAPRCASALTTRVDIASLTPEHAFTLPRLYTNDHLERSPKGGCSRPERVAGTRRCSSPNP